MSDRLLFEIPSELEAALWSMVVLDDYLMTYSMQQLYTDPTASALKKREWRELRLVCRDDEIRGFLEKIYPYGKWIRERDKEQEEDLVFDFDVERARRLSKATDRHITDGLGVLLGAEPRVKLLQLLSGKVSEALVLYLPRHKKDGEPRLLWSQVVEFLRIGTSQKVRTEMLTADVPLEEAARRIGQASLCVGVVGGLTLMAASMHKPLVELYPESYGTRNWAEKWQDRNYRMLYAELEGLEAGAVWQILIRLAEERVKGGEQWRATQFSSRAEVAT